MIINKSLVPGTCHNSLINFYIFVSFLSLGNFILFILYTLLCLIVGGGGERGSNKQVGWVFQKNILK